MSNVVRKFIKAKQEGRTKKLKMLLLYCYAEAGKELRKDPPDEDRVEKLSQDAVKFAYHLNASLGKNLTHQEWYKCIMEEYKCGQ